VGEHERSKTRNAAWTSALSKKARRNPNAAPIIALEARKAEEARLKTRQKPLQPASWFSTSAASDLPDRSKRAKSVLD